MPSQVAEDVAGDERAVGVRWHVEIDGNIFPFSRGVSFYEMDSEGKILKARDVVEGAVKPGTGALQVDFSTCTSALCTGTRGILINGGSHGCRPHTFHRY